MKSYDKSKIVKANNFNLIPMDENNTKLPASTRAKYHDQNDRFRATSKLDDYCYALTGTHLSKDFDDVKSHGNGIHSFKNGTLQEFIHITTRWRNESKINFNRYYDFFKDDVSGYGILNDDIITIDIDLKDFTDKEHPVRFKFDELSIEEQSELFKFVFELGAGMIHISKNHGVHGIFKRKENSRLKDTLNFAYLNLSTGKRFKIDVRSRRTGLPSHTVFGYGKDEDRFTKKILSFDNNINKINELNEHALLDNKRITVINDSLYHKTNHIHKDVKIKDSDYDEIANSEFNQSDSSILNPRLLSHDFVVQNVEVGERELTAFRLIMFLRMFAKDIDNDKIFEQVKLGLRNVVDNEEHSFNDSEIEHIINEKFYILSHEDIEDLEKTIGFKLFKAKSTNKHRIKFPFNLYSKSDGIQIYEKVKTLIEIGKFDQSEFKDYDFSAMDPENEKLFRTQNSFYLLPEIIKGFNEDKVTKTELEQTLYKKSLEYANSSRWTYKNVETMSVQPAVKALNSIMRMDQKDRAYLLAYKLIRNGLVKHGYEKHTGDKLKDGTIIDKDIRVYEDVCYSSLRQMKLAEFMKPFALSLLKDLTQHNQSEQQVISYVNDHLIDFDGKGQRNLPEACITMSEITSFIKLLSYTKTTKKGIGGYTKFISNESGVFSMMSNLSYNANVNYTNNVISTYDFKNTNDIKLVINQNDLILIDNDGQIITKIDHTRYKNLSRLLFKNILHDDYDNLASWKTCISLDNQNYTEFVNSINESKLIGSMHEYTSEIEDNHKYEQSLDVSSNNQKDAHDRLSTIRLKT